MTGTPAGWYDDPEQQGQQRYFDGTAWTEQRRAADTTPPPPPAAPTPPPAASAPPPPPGAATPPPPPGGTTPSSPPPTPTPPPSGAAAPPPASTTPSPAPTTSTPTPPPTDGGFSSPPPTPPPGGPSAPPPFVPGAPAKSSRKGLWIALGVVVGVVVLGIIAIAAIAFLGGGDSATEALEKELPKEVQSAFASKDVDGVTVSKADCDDIGGDDGPFTTTCALTFDNPATTIDVEVTGTIDGSTVNFNAAPLLTEALAVKETQPVVDVESDNSRTVESCALSAPVVSVEEGVSFTCQTDQEETVTFEVQDNTLVITEVTSN